MEPIDPTTLRGDWSYPTRIRFGPGRLAELPEACKALGIERPLVVTDPALAQHAIGRRAVEIARDAGLAVAVFADIRANPVDSNVVAGVEAYKAGSHDGVIAFGGGSGLDAAKAVALMAGQTRPLFDFVDVGDNWTRADAAGIAPVVAIPTTAGTGSEVGRASVITKGDTHEKVIVFHPRMLPGEVILDPELTLGLPPALTAWTGLDALSHSLEALCAPGCHPMADGIALEAIRLVHRWLETAVDDGGDLAARAYMLAAASMGAVAFQKGLGAMHAMAHPVGGLLDAHHGLTIAVVMPYVLKRNYSAVEERLERVARVMGLEGDAAMVLDWITVLRRTFEIPETLDALGVLSEHVPLLAARAAVDPPAATNPISLTEGDYRDLFARALSGGETKMA
jgi:alcohol dehydrogenase class IV